MWYLNTTGMAITINDSQKGSGPLFSQPQYSVATTGEKEFLDSEC